MQAIWEVFQKALQANPVQHPAIIREAKQICSRFLDAPTDGYEIIFTCNSTEGANIAAQNQAAASHENMKPVILTSMLEHSSNDLPWRNIPNHEVIRLSVTNDGFINLDELEQTLADYNLRQKHGNKRITWVALSGASNVMGTCQPLKNISKITHLYNAKFHVDAAQLVAHRAVQMSAVQIDSLSFSAHKVYAPFGSGALVIRKSELNFTQEYLQEIKASGEENVAGIAALGKAFNLLNRIGFFEIIKHERELTAYALEKMQKLQKVKLYGLHDPNHAEFHQKLGVIIFDVKGVIPTKVARELALKGGIGVRSGCHCAHLIVKQIAGVGPGLEKFQRTIIKLFPKLSLPGVIRISFSLENTRKDVDRFLQTLKIITGETPGDTVDLIENSAAQKSMWGFIEDSVEAILPS